MTLPGVIIDIAGVTLTSEDRWLIEHSCVSGVILFARNYTDQAQLRALTNDLRSIKPDMLIFVDQEGGRVQRFIGGFTPLKAMRYFGQLYQDEPVNAKSALKSQLNIMIDELYAVGITATLMPVLDMDYGHNAVIGERSFGEEVDTIIELGQVVIDVFKSRQMPVTAKHFPGHGYVSNDSHHERCVDERALSDIKQNDIAVFKALVSQCDYVMPAHVIYPHAHDQPAGFSQYWLKDVLRHECQFTGQVITDDLSMLAAVRMYPDPVERANAAVDAGCDLLLVCNDRLSAKQIVGYYSA